MQTQRYEALILTVPEVTNDEAAELEKSIEKRLIEHKGSLATYDRWGKFLLAYPVKKNEYGIYFLARFDVPATNKDEVVKELKSLFDLKFNAIVMRYLVSNLANDSALTYKRPQSLEEAPKDVDQFLKENKMSGFHRPHYQRSSEGSTKDFKPVDSTVEEQADKE